ncbi:hypothetical protein [Nitrosomonas communis]|uniref:Uncharacterized protein n=1 Tax=Nitrosomonas communis TaxID=44574 RepID=A0A1I4KMU5_9PROT|nr:hypothetical protein [Nitrosomonas communis]SFL79923.1 hypothetical protein SAMN05421863_1004128 [Nitrosomonas communis]
MEKQVLNLCLIAPIQPALCDAYRRVLHLLEQSRESVGAVIINRGSNSLQEEAGWTTVKSLTDLNSDERKPDVYLCWDLPAINEILGKNPCQPVVYGVTVYGILQGVFPVHPYIMGYLSDTPLLRGILVECGIPLNRQFSLAAGIETEGCPSSESATYQRNGIQRNGVLMISDDAAFSSTVAAACEVLGMRLERFPYAACAQGVPPEFYTRYSCVIATGQPALQAAAAGTPVIIADERGSAGLLTRENLTRVLDAHAGPACFENPAGTEALMSDLGDSQAVEADVLAQQLCLSHSEAARAHQFSVWLRQTHKNAEAGVFVRNGSEEKPQLRSIAAMTGVAAYKVSTTLTPVLQGNCHSFSSSPSTEVLVECNTPVKIVPQPRLPFSCYIAANEEHTLTGFFGEGWSIDEPWGRWTDGSEATIQFELEAVDDRIELLLYLRTYLPPDRLFQRVVVSINSHPLLCWRLDRTTHNAPFLLPLNRAYLDGKSTYRIKFQLPDASSPQSWGKNDSRKLGLGLAGLELLKISRQESMPQVLDTVDIA